MLKLSVNLLTINDKFFMKVAAIIPAYNEEPTIGAVVRAVKENQLIDEIIVVDDGSVDDTYRIAQEAEARVIKIESNQGKASAMKRGVEETDASVFLFLDADLLGLTPQNLTHLIEPVITGELDLSIGTVDRRNLKKYIRWFVQKSDTPVAGQRVLKRELWDMVPEKYKKGYYIESAISLVAREKSLRVRTIVLEGVTHVLKERKYGFWFGMKERIKMFRQIISINLRLRYHYPGR